MTYTAMDMDSHNDKKSITKNNVALTYTCHSRDTPPKEDRLLDSDFHVEVVNDAKMSIPSNTQGTLKGGNRVSSFLTSY